MSAALAPNGFPEFIRQHVDMLLQGWDVFAGVLAQGRSLNADALRDHAREILLAVADDMETSQSDQQQFDKSQGLHPQSSPALNQAAQLHGLGRLADNFNLDDLAVEIRALRASVMRQIAAHDMGVSILEVTRFNEAIDQVLAGSIAAYSRKVEYAQLLERESEIRRQLLLRMDAAQEEDRRRIARELHDSLGQKLVAMSLCLSSLQHQSMNEQGRGQLDQLTSLLAASDRELDQIVFQLRPLDLEDCGLADALSAHATAWSANSGVQVDMVVNGLEGTKLPQNVELAIFRVIQEGLNNVAKHAHAKHVHIALHCRRDTITASVEDDGIGLRGTLGNLPSLALGGWGVAGMRERIEALGGHFTLESADGAGTALLVRLPMKP